MAIPHTDSEAWVWMDKSVQGTGETHTDRGSRTGNALEDVRYCALDKPFKCWSFLSLMKISPTEFEQYSRSM